MKIPQEVTRISFDRIGDLINVEGWKAGWTTISHSLAMSAAMSGRMEALLYECERAGFAVWMPDSNSGRALRGEITRIDFASHDQVWRIKKFPYGWSAKTPALKIEERPGDFDLGGALDWCRHHGWTVREWPGGARAFKDGLIPVRERAAIQSMRRTVQNNMALGHPDAHNQFDLDYDF